MSEIPAPSLSEPASAQGAGDLLTVGFGTAVLMWVAGYIAKLPLVSMHGSVLLIALVLIQIGGGFLLGRQTSRGAGAAMLVGWITSLINLLVLGSFLSDTENLTRILVGVGGFIVMSMVLALLGWSAGRFAGTARRPGPINWTGRFAVVALIATGVLVIAGGLVTGTESGLAVVDWPNTEGMFMFLYPLSRMTGGVYYEHAHRLYGALVGLTTIALAVHVWIADRVDGQPRSWLRKVMIVAVVLVCIQGVLGGLRVTGTLTTSTDPAVTQPNLGLAIVHGVLAQVFLALMVAIVAFTSTTWRNRSPFLSDEHVNTDRRMTAFLLGGLLVQLTLGAAFRHLSTNPELPSGMVLGILHTHITVAVALLVLILLLGFRATGYYRDQPRVKKTGKALMHTVGLQVALGIGAMIAVLIRDASDPIPAWEVIVTTAHQATGALLLAMATFHFIWVRRLLKPA